MVYIPTRYYAEEEEKLPLRVLYVDGVQSATFRRNVGIRGIYVENLLVLAQAAKETKNWYKSLTLSLKLRKRFDVKMQLPAATHWEILSRHAYPINQVMKRVGINGLISGSKSFWEDEEADEKQAYCYNFKLKQRIKVNKSETYYSLFILDLTP